MSKSIFSADHFNDEAAAYAYVEARIWANGRICPHCKTVDRSGALQGKSNRIGLYKCYACRKPFTVKVGTIFEASHIAMRDWLVGIVLMTSSKKGISANQLHRTLGITLKSAWFMAHRVRLAMDANGATGPLGGEGKTVEADETFITRSHKTKKPLGGRAREHRRVLALIERGGNVRSMKAFLGPENWMSISGKIREHVHPASRLVTDSAQHYKFPPVAKHDAVDHSKGEYVRGDVYTNTLEGYFSLFKRGLVGVYQHVDEKHLERYLAEFDFRMNHRAKLGVDDKLRAEIVLQGVSGKRLTYRTTDRQPQA